MSSPKFETPETLTGSKSRTEFTEGKWLSSVVPATPSAPARITEFGIAKEIWNCAPEALMFPRTVTCRPRVEHPTTDAWLRPRHSVILAKGGNSTKSSTKVSGCAST